jgi:Sodium/hydrogen exchanger family
VSPLFSTLVLVLVALLGARVSFSGERVPPGPRLLLRSGTHFLLIGFALGPSALGLLTPEATTQLFPLLALGLGWVGFHFGLQLDRESLASFPMVQHLLGIGQAVISFGIFLGVGWVVLRAAGFAGSVPLLLLMAAASTAAVSTPAGIAMVSSSFGAKGPVRDLLFFIASLDAAVGVLTLQVTYSLFRPEALAAGAAVAPQPALVAVALGLGIVCGIVFLWLVRARPAGEELVLFLLGICAFAAGGALRWGLSPLFVTMTMGAVVANLGRSRQRVFRVLQRWEKPVYVTFLLLAGALLRLESWWVLPLALGYAILRFGSKSLATAVLVPLLPLPFKVPKRLGLGLIPQGGISLAMAVSAVLLYSDLHLRGVDAEATVFAAIVIGVVFSELAGPFLTAHLLRRAGEITPQERGSTPEELVRPG